MKNEGEEEYTKVDEEQRDVLKITDDGFVLEHYKGTESSPCCYHTFTKTDETIFSRVYIERITYPKYA